MQTTKGYLEQVKSFLSHSAARTALKVVPMALVVVAAANAYTFSAPTNSNGIDNCASGSPSGTTTGVAANNSSGLSLSGNGTFSPPSTGSNCLFLFWRGSGSGTVSGATLPILFDFTINTPAGASNTTWTLVVHLTYGNTSVFSSFTCGAGNPQVLQASRLQKHAASLTPTFTGLPCTGAVSGRNLMVNTSPGSTLTSWEVSLEIDEIWNSTGGILSVTVPPANSININAPLGAAVPAIPALSSTALAIAFIALLTMGTALTRRWTPNGAIMP